MNDVTNVTNTERPPLGIRLLHALGKGAGLVRDDE